MKVSNSKERLMQMMSIFNLKPVDICRKCGIQKSSLSNYINGTREPRQDQISLICDPFNINPAWLMGYDVPMVMPAEKEISFISNDDIQIDVQFKDSNIRIEKIKALALKIYNLNINPDELESIIQIYEEYRSAPPQIKKAIETLLKPEKSDS